MRIQIRNARLYTEDCKFHKGNLMIEGERIGHISTCEEDADEIMDAEGCYVIPGLIDLHFHGCAGVDFSDGTVESIEKIIQYERENGITTICPATMTLPEEQLKRIAKSVREYKEKHPASLGLAGFNLEGPFINPLKNGVQSTDSCMLPDVELFEQLQDISNHAIKLVTVAPELEGAEAFIRKASESTVVSVGHSLADYQTASESFALGASHVTHLYNGMREWKHREPGIVGASADCSKVFVELICDGNHLHPSVIRNTWKQYGKERIVMISDSTMAAGLSDGEYTLGGSKVICKEKRVTTNEGVLAGSASNLMECMQYVVRNVNLPLEEVVKCATINPAKVLKIDKNYGSLNCGKYANILILDEGCELRSIIYLGKYLFPPIIL
nr:N-acetylglucosamine-6-phosphate deacetylase [uncultured Lachnoclostridium sp.]